MHVPDSAGVMILSSAVLFPQAMLPLFIFEPRYRTMLAEALDSHRMFCVAMQKPNQSRESPLPIAGIGVVRAAVKNANGTSNLVLQGVARVRLGRVVRHRPYRLQEIEAVEPVDADDVAVEALRHRVLEVVEERLRSGAPVATELLRQLARTGEGDGDDIDGALRSLRRIGHAGHLADLVTLLLVGSPVARQVILQAVDLGERLRHLIQFLGPGSEADPEE